MTAVRSADEFWALVDRSGGPASCWEWQGSRHLTYCAVPYGQVSWPGHEKSAHRMAWELTFGPVPGGRHVLHWCDNPPCVNPDHLWLGTARMNAQHAALKGRKNGPRVMDYHGTRANPVLGRRGWSAA